MDKGVGENLELVMKLPQAKSLVNVRLGNSTVATILDSIELEMALIQETVLEQNGRITPWFLATEMAEVLTEAGEQRLETPSDFIKENDDDGGLYLYDSTQEDTPWVKLTKGDHDDLLHEFQDTQDKPQKYCLDGDYFRLFPTPDAEYTIKMRYYAKDESVAGGDADFENKWLQHASDLVIAETAKACAAHILQDFELAASFDTDIQRAWDRLSVMDTARREAARERNFGDPS